MADLQEVVQQVADELEQRGAKAVDVQGDIAADVFAVGSDTPVQREATVQVDFDGDPEMLENAVRALDCVACDQHHTEVYPGGDVHVSGDLHVVEAVSPGGNPGGNADASPSPDPVPPPSEDVRDPHVPPGGKWGIPDENGITDQREVEVWPVRVWEPRPQVPAISTLRYIPHPSAGGLEWWGGYARLAPPDQVQSAGLYGHMKQRLREKRITCEGHEVGISYTDDSGWVGWSATDLPVEIAGIPVFSSAALEVAQIDHHEAGDTTERLAQAVLEVRREVLD